VEIQIVASRGYGPFSVRRVLSMSRIAGIPAALTGLVGVAGIVWRAAIDNSVCGICRRFIDGDVI